MLDNKTVGFFCSFLSYFLLKKDLKYGLIDLFFTLLLQFKTKGFQDSRATQLSNACIKVKEVDFIIK